MAAIDPLLDSDEEIGQDELEHSRTDYGTLAFACRGASTTYCDTARRLGVIHRILRRPATPP